jgi:hypothetical protein
MYGSISSIRWLRVLGAAIAVIVVSFLIPMFVITVYAFILAFQARGTPDQTAINHFAAWISPRLIPCLEMLLTFIAAFIFTRRTETTRILHGLLIGILTAVLSTGVALPFGGQFSVRSFMVVVAVVALGCLGGFAGQKRMAVA